MLKLIVAAAAAALAVGGVGFATAGNDQGSGVQAWAQVDPHGGTPILVKARNFVSVSVGVNGSDPLPGVYCLHPRAGVDLRNSAPVAAQEQNLSYGFGIVTVRALNGTPNVYCPTNDLQVTTWNADASGSLVNNVAFDVIVP
jgi:hypothetical protein